MKQALRTNTDEALARGVFGVPTAYVDGELFWGFDAMPLLLDHLRTLALFDDDEPRRVADLPYGEHRAPRTG